jgi:hypothetical protein
VLGSVGKQFSVKIPLLQKGNLDRSVALISGNGIRSNTACFCLMQKISYKQKLFVALLEKAISIRFLKIYLHI